MTVLPDTSAWSALLRRRRPPVVPEPEVAGRLRELIDGEAEVVLTGIVYQEILQGVRSEKQRAKLVGLLADFPMLAPTRATHEQAAQIGRASCRERV